MSEKCIFGARLPEISITKKWPIPCENEFNNLAKNDPDALIEWIESGELDPPFLTFAVEVLGTIGFKDKVIPLLIELSRHESELVREGSICGLENYIGEKIVFDRLREIANGDPSLGVRNSAMDALGEENEGKN